MANITQTIPTYTGGISQQPDELKIPGQVNTAKNVLPDVTHGLTKRPGSRLIKSLSDDGTSGNNAVANGKWFSYYRDAAEQYIIQIARDGVVRVWTCSDISSGSYSLTAGSPVIVKYDALNSTSADATKLKAYLTHTTDQDLQPLTLNDNTYITNRDLNNTKTKVQMLTGTSDKEPVRPAEVFVDLRKISYSSQYALNLYDSTTLNSTTTATRISVVREVDTGNACTSGGAWEADGTLPEGGNRCTGSPTSKRDSLCHNVETRIFSIDDGDAIPSADCNGNTSQAVNVKDVGNNDVSADSSRQTATGACKNLYFRIATIGQAVPTDGSSPTYYCRYTTTHDLLYGGEGWKTGDYFYMWMKDSRYKITIEAHSETEVQATMNSNNRSGLIRPEPTPFDSETTITAEGILGGIRQDIVSQNNGIQAAEISQIGTGLYITDGDPFNGSTPVGDLMNVVSGAVNDPEELPQQCKHGYVVKVKNSSSDEDDYYVKFFGDNNRDGEGTWEECAEPGREIKFDPETMPIVITRRQDDNSGTVTGVNDAIYMDVNWVDWDPCQVGDETTNPEPSFVDKRITKLVFFRNRFVLLSDENVVMSRPGDFFNFWGKTAMTFSNSDPIDISCSSTFPAIIYDAIPVNAGLIIFTKNQQFMLTTDSDILNPTTAKINSLANYNFNHNTNPISLGTTVGFLDNAGKYSRFFEMAKILREGEPEVIEQSKIVSRLFNNDLNLIASSRENSLILFGEKNSDTLYGFKYFNATERRLQQSWFTWKLSGAIQYITFLDDAVFAVVKMNNKDILQRFDIKLEDASRTVTDDRQTTSVDDDLMFRVHLDNTTLIDDSAVSAYDAANNRTTFTLPASGFPYTANERQLAVYVYADAADDTFQGMTAEATLSSNTVQLTGNWKTYTDHKGTSDPSDDTTETPSYKLILGYLFDMEVEFPTIYNTRQEGEAYRSDTRSSLVLHRIKLNLSDSGLYETVLERTGKPDYSETWEPVVADAYSLNQIQFTPDSIRTIPVYDRNTNTTLKLKSTHASPATLLSMTWEGDYNTKFYQRV